MFEHQVSSQYQAWSLLPCFLCTTTDTQGSSYEDAHEHSCCLCTSSCSTAAAERNSNSLGAQCQNTPTARLDLQHFKQVRSNRYCKSRIYYKSTCSRTAQDPKQTPQHVVKLGQKQQLELLRQTDYWEPDDSVGKHCHWHLNTTKI